MNPKRMIRATASAKGLTVWSLTALLSACGPGEAPVQEVTITLSPTTARILVTETLQFRVTVRNSANKAVLWTLSGPGCTGEACGTISGGLYTPPPIVPSPRTVTVKVISEADTSKSASATIEIFKAGVDWTWISGSDVRFQPGIYGTRGIADPSNVPGARQEAVSWLDPGGRFWLFGGYGLGSSGTNSGDAGELNDLWRFDPTSLEWTWMSGSTERRQPGTYGTKGTPDPSNVPGARYWAISWIDPGGNLWLFGGSGYDSAGSFGLLNDLWKYDLAFQEWAWVSGSNIRDPLGIYGTKDLAAPSNVPGARQGAASWLDSDGNLWLFGGLGVDSEGHHGWLNDLWKCDPATLEWAWVSGSDISMQPGNYGVRNMPSSWNTPGSRVWAVSWVDPGGKFWLFGGLGYDSAVGGGTLNDLWRFDPATLQWTWVSGSSTNGQAGSYGTKGIPSPSNVPGARLQGATWVDPEGNLWLLGGDGYDSIPWVGQLNDLWKFDPTTVEWTWVSGSDTLQYAGAAVYGIKGVADPLNKPGGRYAAISWLDSQGRFWLFGGGGVDAGGEGGYLNDLWHFIR